MINGFLNLEFSSIDSKLIKKNIYGTDTDVPSEKNTENGLLHPSNHKKCIKFPVKAHFRNSYDQAVENPQKHPDVKKAHS